MNLGNDKWQNTQGKLGSSSTGRGEAPETRGRELESLLATTEYESPTDTVVVRAVLGSQLSRTAVYGPVRTVVWQGSAGDRRPYADSRQEIRSHGRQRVSGCRNSGLSRPCYTPGLCPTNRRMR